MDVIYGLREENVSNVCPNGSYLYETLFPVSLREHFGAAVAYLVVLFNILTLYMFWKAKDFIMSPVTFMLLLLAVTDGMAGLCSFLPSHFGILFNLIEKEKSLVQSDYCLTYILVTDFLFFIFHDFSMLITTSVGIMKVLALRFPIYCNSSFTKRKAFAATALFSPIIIVGEFLFLFEYTFVPSEDGWCCKYYAKPDYLMEARKTGMWIISLFYASCILSMIGSTSYITVKLTFQRFRRNNDSSAVHVSDDILKKNYQSAIMLVLVTICFIMTDILELIALFSMILTEYYGVTNLFAQGWFLQMFSWQRHIAAIGYASNFIIYLFVSQHLRNAITSLVCKK